MEITVTTIDSGTIRPEWLNERADLEIIVPPEARIQSPITVLHLQGALDGSGYQDLLDAIQQHCDLQSPRVILNFSGVDSMSNAGLLGLFMAGSLLQGNPVHDLDGYEVTGFMRSAIEAGQPLSHFYVASLNEELDSIFKVTGFHAIVTTYATLDEAISRFPGR